MNKRSAPFPQTEVGGTWAVCDSVSARSFSAVGYFFGKKLNNTLDIPVGLIDMSWGGTKIEAWTPADVVNLYPETRHSAETMIRTQWAPAIPGVLYNAMVVPIINFNIAGVIWYQGESNHHYAPSYYTLTRLLVNSWRKCWQKEFPFYYVQLAPYRYGGKFETAHLREGQAHAIDIPNSGMIVTTDLVDNLNDIHPAYKRQVGERLAN
jgi:sialate O-acetylesterase